MSIVLDELEEEIDRLLVKQTNRNGFKSKVCEIFQNYYLNVNIIYILNTIFVVIG